MEQLASNFLLLSIAGIWKPRGWHGVKAFLYNTYKFSIVIAIHLFIISGILDLEFRNVELNTLIDNVSLLLAMVVVRQKIGCFILNRSAIKVIVDTFDKVPFKPRDDKEEVISMRFNRLARNILVFQPMIFSSALLFYSCSRKNIIDPPYILPYRGWIPYSYTSPVVYWGTTIFQFYAIYTATAINIAVDPLLSAIICQMCAQIHILRHRFGEMVNRLKVIDNYEPDTVFAERKLIAQWVEYHIHVLSSVKYMNKIFSSVIFVQYTVSSLVLCTLSFLLSHTETMTTNFVGYLGFLTAMYVQIFLPCYCTHMLTIECLNLSSGIFETDWFKLSTNIRKSIIIIVSKCYKPVLITSSFFIVLSLESFTKIIKLSYTIYNVLE
nr:olfactory receptor 120 [Microplitis mediator]